MCQSQMHKRLCHQHDSSNAYIWETVIANPLMDQMSIGSDGNITIVSQEPILESIAIPTLALIINAVYHPDCMINMV